MKDGISNIGVFAALAAAVQAATVKGTAVDLQGFNQATLIINTGAIVGAGNFTASLQESDTTTDGDFTAVDDHDLLGAVPAALEANAAYKLGYVGNKRYVRAVLTLNSGTSIAAGAVFVLGQPYDAPVA